MADELRERLIPHRGLQGGAREEILRDFLRAYLPKRFEVSSGFVFDANGDISQELDTIIVDSMVAPRFEAAGGVRFYPVEAVVAVGQVKTKLTSRKEMWDALANLRSVTVLDRSADGNAACHKTGAPINHRASHLDRVFTFIFIIDRALAADSATEVLFEYIQRTDPHEWPSVTVALNHYLLTFCCDGGACSNPLLARGITAIRDSDLIGNVQRFYVLLSQAITATRVASMSYWDYLGQAISFEGDVAFSSRNHDGPPPFLTEVRALSALAWGQPYDQSDEADDVEGEAITSGSP